MLLISLPNIYNIIFDKIDNEFQNYVTLAIIKKIREQMNYSFLYHANLIEKEKLYQANIDISYENDYIDEIFDFL